MSHKVYVILHWLLSAAGTLALSYGFSLGPLVSFLISVNLVTFLFYGFDKAQAKGGRLRVSERALLSFAFIGGSVGGFFGMILFRHKIRKQGFQLAFWIIVALQISGICIWLVMR